MKKAALAFLGLLWLSWTGFAFGKTIVIYHTNDVHGWIFSRPAIWDPPNRDRAIGGYAALESLVKKEKYPVLLLDSGDIFQGTPEGNLTKGEAPLRLMNSMHYAAMEIGNHDFDYGQQNLKRLVSLASFPVLGANVYGRADDKRPGYLRPYVVLTVDGIRFGIFGLVTRFTPSSTFPKNVADLKFLHEADQARLCVAELKKQKADILIALTHVGLAESIASKRADPEKWPPYPEDLLSFPGDLQIARGAPGIAVILGGHLHTGLVHPYRDPVSKTLICQSSSWLTSTTRLELEFDDKTHRLLKASGKLVDLWVDRTGEDPEIRRQIRAFQDQVGREMDRRIGEAATDIKNSGYAMDSPLGDWITDVMRKAAGAQIAFENTHGIRSDLWRGPVTPRHIFSVMPFDNRLVTLDMTGAQIQRLLRKNLGPGGSFLQVSGMKVVYIPGGIQANVGEESLKKNRVYRVATSDFLAAAGSAGAVFKEARNLEDTGILLRQAMEEEVRNHSPIRAPPTGRIQVRESR